ncbi:DsbA family oxidoreductase [Pseudomonas sp. DCB_AW]|uniref:DsbA family oxidoreductase n=1 Tax=Pseudomonas sp. DCB_AW TaxID=2993596 RepID=UPI002248E24F|nr:DsbA family oxidoreductase [Pseudomonas sp. DCB_AW]MCX2685482.1 DsbA family oxidoreductase [Pseudomonas sp. DCB_AW]
MKHSLSIDVYFDFICPWCLIGKRQLQTALAHLREARPEVEVTLAWHGVQLLPDLPATGQPFADFYRRRLGSDEAVRQRQGQVQEAARAVGELIDFSRIARMPNTADAHRLLLHAVELGSEQQVGALLERLFAAYFREGEDLGDRDTLLRIAEQCGFTPAALAGSLSADGRPFISASADIASRGVPCFVFDDHLRVFGAQPAEQLLDAMHLALSRSAGVQV